MVNTFDEVTANDVTWNTPGNQNLGDYVKIGGKFSSASRYLYSKTAISANVAKIVLAHGTKDSEITVDSMMLDVYSTAALADKGDAGDISHIKSTDFVANADAAFERPYGEDWTGRFFRITYYMKSTASSSNKGFVLNTLNMYASEVIYVNPSLNCKTPVHIEDVQAVQDADATLVYWDTLHVTLSCATAESTIYYTLDGSDPKEGTEYSSAIEIFGSNKTITLRAIATDGDDNWSKELTKDYKFAPIYASLAELVADEELLTGTTVKVTLTDEEIVSIDAAGILLQATDAKQIGISCSNVPEEWQNGGTVSGVLQCPWELSSGLWQLKPDSWKALTYIAPSTPTSLDATSVEVITDKVLRNGQLYILRNGVVYDVAGRLVK